MNLPLSKAKTLWRSFVQHAHWSVMALNVTRQLLWSLVVTFVRITRKAGLRAALRRTWVVLASWTRHLQVRRRARTTSDPYRFAIELPLPQPLTAHQQAVDIVICIHNALEAAQGCLESVIRYTRAPYQMILVDDGSAAATRTYLEQFAFEQGARLLQNETAVGYTLAANQGLRASSGAFIVLLNSDTVVTPDWLDRLMACAESDARIGLVGPLSNTASWQSVPEIFDAHGDWAANALPEGITAADMAQTLAEYSARLYPRMGFLNGFCLLFKRAVLQQLGYFDEATFGRGYGEENDYCLRARQAGWQLAVADDTYIYHLESQSYSHDRRKVLAAQADKALHDKHGSRLMSEGLALSRDNRVLDGIRARARVMWDRERLLADGRRHWEGRRVLFVLPTGEPSGGSNVVWQEVLAMRRMGVDARIANLLTNRLFLNAAYLETEGWVDYYEHPREISLALQDYDAAIATLFISVPWLTPPPRQRAPLVRAYYVQDFEPDFFVVATAEHQQALASYTLYPDLKRLTKTDWNRATVYQRVGVDCTVVGPSVNIDLYRPRPRRDGDWPQRAVRVAAMVRPHTSRRQPQLTLQLLARLQRHYLDRVEIIIFGCPVGDPALEALHPRFPYRNAGVVFPDQLAALFNEVDIFADFSTFQAMGLAALEAMACGVAVIVPQTGGTLSFARPDENCLMIDTTMPELCFGALTRLVDDMEERQHLAHHGLQDVTQYFPERAAYNILAAVFPK